MERTKTLVGGDTEDFWIDGLTATVESTTRMNRRVCINLAKQRCNSLNINAAVAIDITCS